MVEACDQKQEKKYPSYYNNSDCILQKTAFSLVKSRLALGSPGCYCSSPCQKWLNTQKNSCWLRPNDQILTRPKQSFAQKYPGLVNYWLSLQFLCGSSTWQHACNQFSSKKWDTTPPSFSCKIWDLGLQYLGSGITIVGISYDLGSRKIRDTNPTSFYRKIWDLGVPNLGGLRTKDLAWSGT